MKAAALWYAANGTPVIPLHTPTRKGCSCGKNPGAVADERVCRSVGKHPRTATGLKEATTDPHQIEKFWDKWPFANIGVLTGSASGLVVLDLDFRGEGPADRDEVINGFGLWSGTAEVTTGSGGLHVFFR
jgi:hypothetical protein